MNKAIVLWLLLLPFFKATAQEKIEFGHDHCTFCSMVINDPHHDAQAVLEDGTLVLFGSLECLMNYTQSHKDQKFREFYFSDYASEGNYLKAKEATYLQSKAIPSPMGANLSAFGSKKMAQKASSRKEDKIYSWPELQEKFNNNVGENPHAHHDHYRPDAHAPIGMMGDHLHHKGSLMISMRSMNMNMAGNKSGADKIDDDEVYNQYMVVPQKMSMTMYMLGVMYAPGSKLTLMLMQNYLAKDMDLTSKMMMNGMSTYKDFSTEANGIGDLKLSALIGLFTTHKSSLHLNTGISLPVGDIDQHDDTPMTENAKLPYSMQLGSGTFDFTTGATYKQTYSHFSWGSQFLATLRTGKNTGDYRFGNIYEINTWGAIKLIKELSVSLRVVGSIQEEITGADPELNPMMVPTANTVNYGGKKINSFGGFNLSLPQTSQLKNFRLGAEVGIPLYEDYNGIQMDEKLSYTLGLKYTIL